MKKRAIFDIVSRTSASNLRTSNIIVWAFFSSASRYSEPDVSRYSESQGGMVSDEVKDPIHGTTTTGMPAAKRGHEDEGRDDEDSQGGVTGFVAEKAKEGMKKAADETWGAAKETTRTIKEVVAGDEDNKPPHGAATDIHVENLRKRSGGYDLRKDHEENAKEKKL